MKQILDIIKFCLMEESFLILIISIAYWPIPSKDMQTLPLSYGYIFLKDAHCAETNEKSILRFLEFLDFEIWSIFSAPGPDAFGLNPSNKLVLGYHWIAFLNQFIGSKNLVSVHYEPLEYKIDHISKTNKNE